MFNFVLVALILNGERFRRLSTLRVLNSKNYGKN